MDTESVDGITALNKVDESAKLPFIKYLNSIDNTGELLNDKSLVDHVKCKRNSRIEMMTRKMDEARYLEFSKARCASFANRNRHKFSDWIGSSGKFNKYIKYV